MTFEPRMLPPTFSFFRGMKCVYRYVVGELSRGYLLERDEAMFSEKQRRVVTFMKTPRELEKMMLFGLLICLDAFLFIFTFLPIRVLLALSRSLYRLFLCRPRWSETCELCDLFRASILMLCIVSMGYVDTSAVYHMVRAQSVIKLYVIYNMLEIFDRLLASIGQDTLDSLFWSSVEVKEKETGRDKKTRDYMGMVFYYVISTGYVVVHTVVLLFQTVTLNVAVNSNSKALLTIMVSNNFVELKGSVFKKFERNNLFQMSCSDIRERFHYVVLLCLVSVRNLAQFNWNPGYLGEMVPIIFLVLVSEVFVDWTKHAFITKFNDISPDVYREYRSILAKDLASSQHQQAKSDRSDLVSRRMGFIPLPFICLVWRTVSQSFSFPGLRGAAVLAAIYFILMSVKVVVGILLMSGADRYSEERRKSVGGSSNEGSPSSCGSEMRSGDVGGEGVRQRAARKPAELRKQRSLSEVERYTVVSNRIV